jgi:NADPH2:quinone reductase
VACLSGTGGFGTHTIAPARLCMPLPEGFPFVDAAAFIMIYATSHHALVDRAQLKAGETVLVLGAAGGVGTAAIQIAKAMGARVIAAASTDEKCELCRSIGADATINYTQHAVPNAFPRRDQGRHRRQGPGRDLRPGRRRLRRAGLPLDRLARPLPGGRLRRRPDPDDACR